MKKSTFFAALTAMIAIVAFTGLFYTAGAGQGANNVLKDSPGSISTDYRPGATNPVKNPSRLFLFRDDYLCTLFGNLGAHTLTRNWNFPTTSGDLTAWHNHNSAALKEPDYGKGLNKNVISPTALAMGRINSPKKDDVVGAFYYIDGKKVKPYVFFVDHPEVNSTRTDPFRWDFPDDTSYDNYYSIDIAVGDVDRELNDDEYNMEIVVAFRMYNKDYRDKGHDIYIVVLDKDLKFKCHTVINGLDYIRGDNQYSQPHFSVTMGDYNNDGDCEIAWMFRTVQSSGGNQKYEIGILDWDGKEWVLKDGYTYGLDVEGNNQFNAVDLTSGDFNGDGTDEIAACISSFQQLWDDPLDMMNLLPHLWIFTTYDNTDKVIKLEKRGRWRHPTPIWYAYGSVRGAAITSGLFTYDGHEFTTARRQIAMACVPWQSNYYVNVLTFMVDEDFHPTVADNFLLNHPSEQILYSQDNTCIPKITAGNFKGINIKSDVQTKTFDQIAVSWADDKHPKFAVFDLHNGLKLSLKYHGDFHPGQPGTSDQEFMSVPIMAADRDGKGYYLGAPVHLVIPSMLRANYIIQEPPKHLDYLPDDDGKWQIVNISKTKKFYSTFTDEEDETFTHTHQNKTNFAIGGSLQVSAKQTIKGDLEFVKAGITTQEKAKASYDYKSVTSDLDGSYSKSTYQWSEWGWRDDYVDVHFKVMDIWRFPIIGLKDENNLNAFYDVVMPGNSGTEVSEDGCDMSDYYQPLHEIGNILSYPQISDENFPKDKGSYISTDAAGNDHELDEEMSDLPILAWGTDKATIGVNWTTTAWTVTERSHTHKFNFSADFQVGFQAESYMAVEKQKWYTNIDVSFHTGKSWTEADYAKNTMTTSKGVSIDVPGTGIADQAYQFKPAVYSTKDGTLKLAFAVDPTGTHGDWWTTHYHKQHDLSLNLPLKFWWEKDSQSSEYTGWYYFNKYRQERSRMRRLFLLHNEPKTKDTDRLFVATAPTAGDIVYVLTTVYNYSLPDLGKRAMGPFLVRFNYAEYDPYLKDGDPGFDTDPSTNLIGDVAVDGLLPLEHRDVYVRWDIPTDAGGDEPGTSKQYVIYVTVDPDDNVSNEIHELDIRYYSEDYWNGSLDPCPISRDVSTGQITYSQPCNISCASNNQGFWPWDNSFAIFSPKDADEVSPQGGGMEVSIAPESLELETTSESEGYGDYLFITHMAYRLKLKIVASEADKTYREVFFYDNDKAFSVKRSFGLNPGENDFYCRWTPEEPGVHTLKVEVFEDRDDPDKGNNFATLDVEVLDSQIPHHR